MIPTLEEFDPREIPWQQEAISYIYNFDYTQGVCELMFSGSIGSAKSLNAVHIGVMHCLENKGAKLLIVRRALKDLKRTFWDLLLKHLAHRPDLIKKYNKSEMKITLINGSEIIGDSYDDMNLEKFRSLELSMSIIEEATESEKEVLEAIKMRVGRILSVKKNIMLLVTNPDSPSHYLYESFIEKGKKVFYSLTHQNKFLPGWYIDNLKKDLDPKMARRMLYGEWIELSKDMVYYNYSTEQNFRHNFDLPIDELRLCHDFNIGGPKKPMSAAACVLSEGVYHCFKSFHVEGARTENIMEEVADSGLLDQAKKIYIYGDASGRNRDTRSIKSDYDIIETFLANYKTKDGRKLDFELRVPRSNPPLRRRHNLVNSYFLNDNKEVRLLVYDKWIDKGFRLTGFKNGSLMLEDDNLAEQHVTTAIGYMIDYDKNKTTEEFKEIQL